MKKDMVKKLEYSKPNLVKLNVDETSGGTSKHHECKTGPGQGHGRTGNPSACA